MLNHLAALITCRARLATLEVCTTGTTTLEATATGFVRLTGSFVTDGFQVGMEVLPAGFTSTTRQVVKNVAALTLTVEGTPSVQASGSGRSLTVGQPEYRAYPNVKYDPKQAAGRPYTKEEWLPGPSSVTSLGPLSQYQAEPIYIVKVYGLSERGSAAIDAYTDAILELFAPGTAMTLSTGDTLTVKRNPAPFKGQILNPSDEPGRAVVTITIPLWGHTTNAV
jgi:hypothetical protein